MFKKNKLSNLKIERNHKITCGVFSKKIVFLYLIDNYLDPAITKSLQIKKTIKMDHNRQIDEEV